MCTISGLLEVTCIMSLFVPVDGAWCEGGEADRDVLAAVFTGGAVPNPFTGGGVHCLAGVDGERFAGLMLDLECPAQHYGILVELWTLAGFHPTTGAAHVRDTEC